MIPKAASWNEMFGIPKEFAVKKVDCPYCDLQGFSKEDPESMCGVCGGFQELLQKADGTYIPQ